jgi:glutathione S-transferase
MARVVGLEQRVGFEYRIIDVYSAAFLDRLNPLRQIPTLVIDDEEAIFDSRAIFACFDAMSDLPPLIDPASTTQATRISLCIGLSEACLAYRMETVRPRNRQSPDVLDKQIARMQRCMGHVAGRFDDFTGEDRRIEKILLGCSLEYVDYRFSRAWRNEFPRLAAFSDQFGARDSMAVSRPYG